MPVKNPCVSSQSQLPFPPTHPLLFRSYVLCIILRTPRNSPNPTIRCGLLCRKLLNQLQHLGRQCGSSSSAPELTKRAHPIFLQEPNVSVSANLFVNVYGMHPFNLTLDLCSLAHGALCPLPMYNFIGEDSIPLSRYLNISEYVPAIAYKVPDLEAFVQLTLVEIGTSDVKACVQATLSNGWTTHESGVEWATGAFAFVAFVSALWQSRKPDSITPYRLLDIMYLFQAIAASGLLNLNYPIVYRSFTFNFRWALGFFYSPGFQTAINDMRNRTGGHLDDVTGNALALTNRKSSPYNAMTNLPTIRITSFADGGILSRSEDVPDLARLNSSLVLAATDVQTVTSTNTIKQGIPIWLTTIGVPEKNAFMNVFFVTLILFGTVTAAVGIAYLVLRHLRKPELAISERFTLDECNRVYAKSWLLRLVCHQVIPLTVRRQNSPLVLDAYCGIPCHYLFLLSVDIQGLLACHPPIRHSLPSRGGIYWVFSIPGIPLVRS